LPLTRIAAQIIAGRAGADVLLDDSHAGITLKAVLDKVRGSATARGKREFIADRKIDGYRGQADGVTEEGELGMKEVPRGETEVTARRD